MPSAESACYHSLRPFAALFETGLPVLTYHKLGPRPARTRLKGLYVSQRLFAKHLAELRQAGFLSANLNALSKSASASGSSSSSPPKNSGPASPPSRHIILTFD